MLTRRQFLMSTLMAGLGAPFVLGAGRAKPLRLGLVADVQFADVEPGKTRFYRDSLGKLAEAIDHFNTLPLEWCMGLGDLIDRNWDSFPRVFDVLKKSRHRFHHVLGNHDFDVADEFKSRVPKRLGLKDRYYAVETKGFCFVMLNTTDISLYAHPRNSKESQGAAEEMRRLAAEGTSQAQPWNGAVGDVQLEWFKKTCRSAAKSGRKVIVFSHHPVFPAAPHNAWNAGVLVKTVEAIPNVVAWINGHNYAGDCGVHAGISFLTLRGMVETKDSNTFAVAELHPDRLELTGHGREPNRILPFRTG